MLGQMQDWSMTLDKVIDHAAHFHGAREIVTRSIEGPIVRTTYAEVRRRAKQVSNALLNAGIKPGDRVATMAFNTARHLEAWYGIMGIGAVCHTLNPRLHADQICWIIRHAQDRIVFVDPTFAALMIANMPNAPCVERVVVLTDARHRDAAWPKDVLTYEEWIAGEGETCAWGAFGEETAAGLCYTSGTTGDPKGVLYSHRSNFLHTLMTLQTDVMGLSAQDTVLPVVPMFHANAWGVAFSAPGAGAKLVMPGAKMDGPSIYELLETEGVTFSAAVPTVWQMLLHHLESTGEKLSTLKRVVIGGAACPESIIRGFHDRYGVDVVHAWGMTEMSPLGTLGTPTAEVAALSFDEQIPYLLKQGRPPLGVELMLKDDEGKPIAEDGEAFGHLVVRGPIVVKRYFKAEKDALDKDGYFDTGDIATLDSNGYMQITDRAKDVIKSGGEWISSIEIENIAAGHPKAALAAVVGMPHPKWDERPLLLIQLKPGQQASKEEMLKHLEGKIAKWWTPDDVLFVDVVPLGPTGKIDKKLIRQQFVDYRFPSAQAAE